MTKTIRVQMSPSSVDKAIKELKQYQSRIKVKQELFLTLLASIGVKEAEIHFNPAVAQLMGTRASLDIDVVTTDKGFNIVASGAQVAFLEFGAGVSSGTGYKGIKPPEIGPIGTHGKGKGSRDSWTFWASEEKTHWLRTSGNAPAMGMYYASKRMQDNIRKIAREVFSSD